MTISHCFSVLQRLKLLLFNELVLVFWKLDVVWPSQTKFNGDEKMNTLSLIFLGF